MLARGRQMRNNSKFRDEVLARFSRTHPVTAFRKDARSTVEPGKTGSSSLSTKGDSARAEYLSVLPRIAHVFRFLFSSTRQDVPFTGVLKGGNRNDRLTSRLNVTVGHAVLESTAACRPRTSPLSIKEGK